VKAAFKLTVGRRAKSKHEVPMSISLNPDSIRINPQDSAGTAIYQPIGKVRRALVALGGRGEGWGLMGEGGGGGRV
jgi:hypothetical protein